MTEPAVDASKAGFLQKDFLSLLKRLNPDAKGNGAL